MKFWSFVIIFLFCSISCFGFENSSIKYNDPAGWVKQPNEVKGVNGIYFSIPSAKKSNSSAVLVVTSTPRPKTSLNVNDFLKKSMSQEVKKYPDFKLFALKNLAEIKSPHALKQFTYSKDGERFKGLNLMIQSKSENHLFYFTVGEEFYPAYEPDILALMKTIKLKN